MGGYRTDITIKKIDTKHYEQFDVNELVSWIITAIRKNAITQPDKNVINGYISQLDVESYFTDTNISFSFSGAAGLCRMSSELTAHWFELVPAGMKTEFESYFHHFGYTYKDIYPDIEAVKQKSETIFVLIEGKYFGAYQSNKEIIIFADGEKYPEFDDLSETDKSRKVTHS